MGTPEGTIIAFDYGQARIGTSVGNSITATAAPLITIAATTKAQRWQAIDELLNEWQPVRLVLGLPVSAADDAPELLREINNFGKQLQKRYDLPVNFVDESYSSVEANKRLKHQRQQGRRKKLNKQEIDQQAAVIILERWLEESYAE